ncbi:hypothetical protein ACFWDI_39490 [Streptomyces sp. NPDC060064]|uniref:hypothetical protein n=1 Tax=Streptomyces sp. NPDC060064 TaxID=3347049 RepID=UPI0036A4EA24
MKMKQTIHGYVAAASVVLTVLISMAFAGSAMALQPNRADRNPQPPPTSTPKNPTPQTGSPTPTAKPAKPAKVPAQPPGAPAGKVSMTPLPSSPGGGAGTVLADGIEQQWGTLHVLCLSEETCSWSIWVFADSVTQFNTPDKGNQVNSFALTNVVSNSGFPLQCAPGTDPTTQKAGFQCDVTLFPNQTATANIMVTANVWSATGNSAYNNTPVSTTDTFTENSYFYPPFSPPHLFNTDTGTVLYQADTSLLDPNSNEQGLEATVEQETLQPPILVITDTTIGPEFNSWGPFYLVVKNNLKSGVFATTRIPLTQQGNTYAINMIQQENYCTTQSGTFVCGIPGGTLALAPGESTEDRHIFPGWEMRYLPAEEVNRDRVDMTFGVSASPAIGSAGGHFSAAAIAPGPPGGEPPTTPPTPPTPPTRPKPPACHAAHCGHDKHRPDRPGHDRPGHDRPGRVRV